MSKRTISIFLAIAGLGIAINESIAEELCVTVTGTLIAFDADPFDLHQANFELSFIYDSEAPLTSDAVNGGCAFADSSFPFVEATYSFSNRPNGAPNASSPINGNIGLRNAYDCSPITDRFRVPQGSLNGEFATLIGGNGAALDFGTNMFFPGSEVIDELPVISEDDIESVFWGTYVFFSQGEVLYNYDSAKLVSIEPKSKFLLGDANCDGSVNLLDVPVFVDLILDNQFDVKADINSDGLVNLLDVEPFVALIAP